MKYFKVILLLIMTALLKCYSKKIAIIGGGIGGSATAYFTREYLGSDAEIHLFEADKIGGRLDTVKIKGKLYESGGAIIHPRNKYMVDFVEAMGLEKRKELLGKNHFGLSDGKQMVFTESSNKLFTFFKLFWRYGFNLRSMNNFLTQRLDKFDRIYEYQNMGISFENVKLLLGAMSPDFPKSCETQARQGLLDAGLSETLTDELVAAAVLTNYAQDLIKTHDFVAFVSIAGSDSDLWSVLDGNKQVPNHLIQTSKAKVKLNKVYKISDDDENKFKVYWLDKNENSENDTYDAVVIATPITDQLKYKIQMPALDNPIPKRNMQKLAVTFVQGTLNYSLFGLKESDTVDEIFMTNENLKINSIGRVYPVDDTEDSAPVYKVFSGAPLSTEQLDLLFIERNEVKLIEWYPYPKYNYKEPLEGSFVLKPGIFYVNAIEWAASAMEMSAIGAKNVALLVREYFYPSLRIKFEPVANNARKLEL